MADRLEHAPDLAVTPLVEDELDPRRAEPADPAGAVGPSSSSTPAASRASVSSLGSPRTSAT